MPPEGNDRDRYHTQFGADADGRPCDRDEERKDQQYYDKRTPSAGGDD